MDKKIKKTNRLVFLAGFLLLFLVVFLTFLRPILHRNSVSKDAASDIANAPEQSAPKITPKELFQKISSGEKLNIIDIRSSDAFQKEHLQNSRNIPAENVANAMEKNKFYILIDDGNSGESRNLAANLKDGDVNNVFYLDGGFQNWKNSNFPTISAGDPNSITDQAKVSYITPENLKTAIEKNDGNIFLIDVRNADIFSFEHLKNAVNIPLSDIEKRKSEISPSKEIVVYDNNGTLSFQVAVKLFDLNFFNASILSGGLDAWKQKSFEITR